MDLNIGKKICRLRKLNNLTQEQLAEYLCVSNAAVSKWESGNSYPDITLLPAIAKLFKVSIDTLFMFEINNDDLDEIRKTAEELKISGKYNEALNYLEDSLLKYPNDLSLNLLMARTLLTSGMNSKAMNKNHLNKSILYFDKALVLDYDDKNKESIIQNKSFILASLGKYEEANKLLEGLNNNKYIIQIANNYIKMGNENKGMQMLQMHLNDLAFSFAWLTGTLAKCLKNSGNKKEAIELNKMCATFREYMTNEDRSKANYYDFLVSKDFLDVAIETLGINDLDAMWMAIEKAVHYAIKFDNNPNFNLTDVKFLYGLEGKFDSGNAKACPYVKEILTTKFSKFQDDQRYKNLIDRL